jgi:hypothetical protein
MTSTKDFVLLWLPALKHNQSYPNNTFPPHPTTLFIMLRVALTGAITRATARSAIVAAPRSTGK